MQGFGPDVEASRLAKAKAQADTNRHLYEDKAKAVFAAAKAKGAKNPATALPADSMAKALASQVKKSLKVSTRPRAHVFGGDFVQAFLVPAAPTPRSE